MITIQDLEKMMASGQYNEIIKCHHDQDFQKIIIILRAYRSLGRTEDALKLLPQARNIASNELEYIEVDVIEAYTCWQQGDYRSADKILGKHIQQIESKEKSEDTHTLKVVADYYHLLNSVRNNWVEYKKSFDYINKSIEVREKLGDKSSLARCYNNLGVKHKYLGDLDNALIAFEKSLTISQEVGNVLNEAFAIANINELNFVSNEKSMFYDNYKKLENIYKTSPENNLIKMIYSYNKAVYLKQQANFEDWLEATQLFNSLIEGEVLHVQYYVNSMYHLAEMYIEEMRVMKNEKLLGKIHSIINKLLIFGFDHRISSVLIYAKLFQSQYLFLTGKVEEAKKLLFDISMESIDNGELYINSIVSKELDNVLQQEDDILSLLNANILEKLDIVHFDTTFKDTLGIYPKKNDVIEVPILFLILNDVGVELFSKKLTDYRISDNQMSKFYEAINSFLFNAFRYDTGYVERIDMDRYIVVIKKIKELFFVYIVTGNTALTINRINLLCFEMKNTLDQICSNLNYYNILRDDVEKFELAIIDVFQDIL